MYEKVQRTLIKLTIALRNYVSWITLITKTHLRDLCGQGLVEDLLVQKEVVGSFNPLEVRPGAYLNVDLATKLSLHTKITQGLLSA